MNSNRAGNSQFGFFKPPKTTSKRVTLAPPPFQLHSSPANPKPAAKDSLRTGLEHLGQLDLSQLRRHILSSRPESASPLGQVLHIES